MTLLSAVLAALLAGEATPTPSPAGTSSSPPAQSSSRSSSSTRSAKAPAVGPAVPRDRSRGTTATERWLLEVARRERARRSRLRRHAPVLDDEELRRRNLEWRPVVAASVRTPADERGTADETDAAMQQATDQEADDLLSELQNEVRDETHWRERMATARHAIEELEIDLAFTRKQLMYLRMDLVVPADPMREFNRKTDVDRLFAEVARLERELDTAKGEPHRIRQEARRARARPGWVR